MKKSVFEALLKMMKYSKENEGIVLTEENRLLLDIADIQLAATCFCLTCVLLVSVFVLIARVWVRPAVNVLNIPSPYRGEILWALA